MYEISNYSGKLRNTVTGDVFPQDDNEPLYPPYVDWFRDGNIPEVVEFFDGEEMEEKQKKAVEIDLYYTKLIGELLTKHQNKSYLASEMGQVYVTPQVTLDEVEALKVECNAKIVELGITDYTYRQSHPILAKGIFINL